MNLTSLIRGAFERRARATLEAASDIEACQRRELSRLLRAARHTCWGRAHSFGAMRSYVDYRSGQPVTPYEELRPHVMRMIAGERDVLWPGRTRRFAQSSGTSDGKSKYIPVTADSLRLNHYRGGREAVSHYLNSCGDSRLFDGRAFILGGSFANELPAGAMGRGVRVGDLSANLIEAVNPLVNLLRVPSRSVALMADWEQKLPRLVEGSLRADVTNISGVPSWFLTVLRSVIGASGATCIHDVWPHLEVFFHGGIAFGPYRELYRAITDPARMRYVETYNASEGFFAVQDSPDSQAMLLLPDAGVFYEFIPTGRPEAEPLPAWELTAGQTYALLITAANGLWRYPIGDVVRVATLSPLRITIAGRTKCYINAFGEEVMVHNTDAALSRACREAGCSVRDYTAAPVWATATSRGRHQWLIEFDTPPADLHAFERLLDRCLADENSDYQAKRAGGIFLDCLTVTPARRGLFDAWLGATGRLGGQRKVPRLAPDRTLIEAMLRLNGPEQ